MLKLHRVLVLIHRTRFSLDAVIVCCCFYYCLAYIDSISARRGLMLPMSVCLCVSHTGKPCINISKLIKMSFGVGVRADSHCHRNHVLQEGNIWVPPGKYDQLIHA